MASKRKELVRAVDEKAAESIAKVFFTEPEIIENDTTNKVTTMVQNIGSTVVQGKAMDIARRKLPSYQGPVQNDCAKGYVEPEF